MTKVKYDKAWDNIKHVYVEPDQVEKCERHDRNRYFSEKFEDDEDRGKVLTLCKTSKAFKRKNSDKEIKVKAHFMAIADNTKSYREQTKKKQAHQESLVHKLCKNVIEPGMFIKVPEFNVEIMDRNVQVINSQYIKVKEVNHIEYRDSYTNKIPDMCIKVDLLGFEQEIYLEFCYTHAVDENKRRMYNAYGKNALEIDISELRDRLDDSEASLKRKLKEIISEQAYWLSNGMTKYVKYATDELLIEISTTNDALLRTSYDFGNKSKFDTEEDYLKSRLYLFKDNLLVDNTHKCYFQPGIDQVHNRKEKCVDIGECRACKNCVYLSNYEAQDNDIDKIKIYCSKKNLKERYNPVELTTEIIERAKEGLRKQEI